MAYNTETRMYEGFIYIILNDIDPDQMYIGQTTCTPDIRWRAHCHQVKDHTNTDKLHNKMEKYGIEHFALEVLEHHKLQSKQLLLERLDEREIALIEKFNSYYSGLNATKGGRSGKEHKMRAVLRFDLDGNFIAKYESVDCLKSEFSSVTSIYDCCGHYNARYAYGSLWKYEDDNAPLPVLNEDEKSEAMVRYLTLNPIKKYDYKGNLIFTYKNATDVLKSENISREQLLRSCTGKTAYAGEYIYRFECDDFYKYKTYKPRMRIVEQYDLDNNLLNVYRGTREAGRQTGILHASISYACRNNGGLFGGYIWKYGDIVNK